MKRLKICVNIILISVLVFSILAFSLPLQTCIANWKTYNFYYRELYDVAELKAEYEIYLRETLCITFSIIFSALSAIASAVAFCLLNFKVWKKDKSNSN